MKKQILSILYYLTVVLLVLIALGLIYLIRDSLGNTFSTINTDQDWGAVSALQQQRSQTEAAVPTVKLQDILADPQSFQGKWARIQGVEVLHVYFDGGQLEFTVGTPSENIYVMVPGAFDPGLQGHIVTVEGIVDKDCQIMKPNPAKAILCKAWVLDMTPTSTPPPVMISGDFGILSQKPCGPPCFLGIRPDVTTLDDAALMLKNAGVSCVVIKSRNTLNCQNGNTFIQINAGLTVDMINLTPPAYITLGQFVAQYGPPDSFVPGTGVPRAFYDSLHTAVLLRGQPPGDPITPGMPITGVNYMSAANYQSFSQMSDPYKQPWKCYGKYP